MPISPTSLKEISQNEKLAIRLISPTFGHVPQQIKSNYGLTHRKPYYFILLMLEGQSSQRVDLQNYSILANELLFIVPHQIHQLPTARHDTNYFKIGFDDHCLSLLPKHFPFLLNPYNNQKLKLTPAIVKRITSIFESLSSLLTSTDTDPELILPYLNSLLSEINIAYFDSEKNPTSTKLSEYIRFKQHIEATLTDQPSIQEIATSLGLNTNSLYYLVKQFSGLSPKEFISNRLILEAKRLLYYNECTSIKELAFKLGYNDPEYFSRLFKKSTGQSIPSFIQDLSGY